MSNIGLYNRASSGRDINVYLCDTLLDNAILSYSVVEGGSTDKLASYNSNVTQHFALSPTVAEITLNYYHSPELDDKMNRIIYDTMLSTIRGMTTLNQTINRPYDNVTRILKKALDYVQENYKTPDKFSYETISKRILTELYKNYGNHADEFIDILKMNTMSLNKTADVITNSAITRLTMVYSSYITMYYNSALYVLANIVQEEAIVTDLLFKHWFFMCLHSRLNIYIVSNRKRHTSDTKADFEKYIGIFPIGAYVNQSDNSSSPILKSKTFYSIGRFDDDLSISNRYESIEDLDDLISSFDITLHGITFRKWCEYKQVFNTSTLQASTLINNFVPSFYKLSMALSNSLNDENKVNLVRPFISDSLDLSFYEHPWYTAGQDNDSILNGNTKIAGGKDNDKLILLYRNSKFTKNRTPTKELFNVCFGDDRIKTWETLLKEQSYLIDEVLKYKLQKDTSNKPFGTYIKNNMAFFIRNSDVSFPKEEAEDNKDNKLYYYIDEKKELIYDTDNIVDIDISGLTTKHIFSYKINAEDPIDIQYKTNQTIVLPGIDNIINIPEIPYIDISTDSKHEFPERKVDVGSDQLFYISAVNNFQMVDGVPKYEPDTFKIEVYKNRDKNKKYISFDLKFSYNNITKKHFYTVVSSKEDIASLDNDVYYEIDFKINKKEIRKTELNKEIEFEPTYDFEFIVYFNEKKRDIPQDILTIINSERTSSVDNTSIVFSYKYVKTLNDWYYTITPSLDINKFEYLISDNNLTLAHGDFNLLNDGKSYRINIKDSTSIKIENELYSFSGGKKLDIMDSNGTIFSTDIFFSTKEDETNVDKRYCYEPRYDISTFKDVINKYAIQIKDGVNELMTLNNKTIYLSKESIFTNKILTLNIRVINPDKSLEENSLPEDSKSEYTELQNKLIEYYGDESIVVNSDIIKLLNDLNSQIKKESLIVITEIKGNVVTFKNILIKV